MQREFGKADSLSYITNKKNMKKVLVVLVVALSIVLVKFSNKIVELEKQNSILQDELNEITQNMWGESHADWD